MNPKLRAGWKHFTEGVAAAAFLLMFAAFMVQIVSRYVFNMPVAWTLEVCSIGYIWVVFWACDLLVTERQQIVFDIFYLWFKPGPRRILAVANTAALGIVFLAAIPGTFDYLWFLRRRDTMSLHIPFYAVYACFGVFMVAVIVGAAIRLRRLFGADWQRHL